MPELVPVRVRDCACPDTPHDDGDIVYVRPKISLEGGIAAQQDIVAAGGDAEALTRRWLVTFVRFGAVSWNFTDEDGAPVPFDVGVLIDDFDLGGSVAEKANDLYAEAVLRPLGLSLSPAPKNSRNGQTAGSTSRTRRSATRSRAS